MTHHPWINASSVEPFDFRCGHCGREVASNQGFQTSDGVFVTYVCPRCNRTSFTAAGQIVPGAPFGNEVAALPEAINALYREARQAVQANAYTAAVLTCRKVLMHVAVAQGAESGKSFISYVEYLAESGYVPPNGRAWVDHIRKRGNEANHEISVMSEQDAAELVIFVEMLLKFVYELPSLIPGMPAPS